MEELVKMSPKGQLVVPQEIRIQESFKPSDRFIAVPIKNGVVFKRVNLNLKTEFASLSKEISKQFSKNGVTKQDVKGAVARARRKLS